MTNYPECDKLSLYGSERRNIVEFIEWLCENGHGIYDRVESRYEVHPGVEPTRKSRESLVLQFLGVDEKELEKERRRILDAQREANGEE